MPEIHFITINISNMKWVICILLVFSIMIACESGSTDINPDLPTAESNCDSIVSVGEGQLVELLASGWQRNDGLLEQAFQLYESYQQLDRYAGFGNRKYPIDISQELKQLLTDIEYDYIKSICNIPAKIDSERDMQNFLTRNKRILAEKFQTAIKHTKEVHQFVRSVIDTTETLLIHPNDKSLIEFNLGILMINKEDDSICCNLFVDEMVSANFSRIRLLSDEIVIRSRPEKVMVIFRKLTPPLTVDDMPNQGEIYRLKGDTIAFAKFDTASKTSILTYRQ